MEGGSIVKPEEIYSWLNFAEICQFANLAIFFAKASSRTITSESKKNQAIFLFSHNSLLLPCRNSTASWRNNICVEVLAEELITQLKLNVYILLENIYTTALVNQNNPEFPELEFPGTSQNRLSLALENFRFLSRFSQNKKKWPYIHCLIILSFSLIQFHHLFLFCFFFRTLSKTHCYS